MIFMTRSSRDPRWVLIIQLTVQLYLSNCSCYEEQQSTPRSPGSPPIATTANCALYKYVGVNDLSINDIVVKSDSGDLACIKARFSLAIKVETEEENTLIAEPSNRRPGSPGGQNSSRSSNDDANEKQVQQQQVESKRLVLGYLPLDSIISVKDTCPSPKAQEGPAKDGFGGRTLLKEPNELEMVVSFECGKLAFTFKQEDKFYLSSINGFINLDSSTIREFTSEEPMFFTSDLAHHFRSTELIEVNSSAKSKAFILTANFYHLEFEAFRNTSSRAFILSPDDNSKIYAPR